MVSNVAHDRLLVVDADGLLRWSIQTYFARWFDVVAVPTVSEARAALHARGVRALVASEDLPRRGMAILERLARRHDPATTIVYMGTRLATQRPARRGANYVEKPNVLPQLVDLLGIRTRGADPHMRDVTMFIDDYMTTNPVTVRSDAPLSQAESLLRKHRFHHLPVLDDADRLVGIITDRDVRTAAGLETVLSEKLMVGEVMTADPLTISPKVTLDEALAMFCTNRFGALPVTDRDKLIGIITTYDILRAFYDVLGLDQVGCRIEIALPDVRADLAQTFQALKDTQCQMISAVVSRMRRDGGEPALYLRIAGSDPRPIERHLRERALIVLEPEGR